MIRIKEEFLELSSLVGMKDGKPVLYRLEEVRRWNSDLTATLGVRSERPAPAEVFYRIRDEIGARLDIEKRAGPDSLISRYIEFGGNKIGFILEYQDLFGEMPVL